MTIRSAKAWFIWCWPIAAAALGQGRDFSAVEIAVNKVSDTIHMLEGAGGNIGVWAGHDGAFLIDDQYTPLTERILAAITSSVTNP